MPRFEFSLSKGHQIGRKEVVIKFDDRDSALVRSTLNSKTKMEKRGSKASQRSEIRETWDSSLITQSEEWICYSFEFRIHSKSGVPANLETPAKLTLAQFHQEPVGSTSQAPPALFFNLTPQKSLSVILGDELGGRNVEMIPSKEKILGRWWRINIAARWAGTDTGRLFIMATSLDKKSTFEVRIDGPNTTTGHVYQKLGAYRSFLERDPKFGSSTVEIRYRNITRNGTAVKFRQD